MTLCITLVFAYFFRDLMFPSLPESINILQNMMNLVIFTFLLYETTKQIMYYIRRDQCKFVAKRIIEIEPRISE